MAHDPGESASLVVRSSDDVLVSLTHRVRPLLIVVWFGHFNGAVAARATREISTFAEQRQRRIDILSLFAATSGISLRSATKVSTRSVLDLSEQVRRIATVVERRGFVGAVQRNFARFISSTNIAVFEMIVPKDRGAAITWLFEGEDAPADLDDQAAILSELEAMFPTEPSA